MSQLDKVAAFVLTTVVTLFLAVMLVVSFLTGDWTVFGTAVVALLFCGLVWAVIGLLFAIGDRLFPDR